MKRIRLSPSLGCHRPHCVPPCIHGDDGDDYYTMKGKRKFRLRRWRLKLWQKDPRCHYCRCRIHPDESSLDHLLPRSRGGRSTRENLVLACKRCNNAKGDMTKEEYLATISATARP